MRPASMLGGRRLWNYVVDEFELAEHERSLLLEAARTADTIEDLQSALDMGRQARGVYRLA